MKEDDSQLVKIPSKELLKPVTPHEADENLRNALRAAAARWNIYHARYLDEEIAQRAAGLKPACSQCGESGAVERGDGSRIPCPQCSVLRHWARTAGQRPWVLSPVGSVVIDPQYQYQVRCPNCRPDRYETVTGGYVTAPKCAFCTGMLHATLMESQREATPEEAVLDDKPPHKDLTERFLEVDDQFRDIYAKMQGAPVLALQNALRDYSAVWREATARLSEQHHRLSIQQEHCTLLEEQIVTVKRQLKEAAKGGPSEDRKALLEELRDQKAATHGARSEVIALREQVAHQKGIIEGYQTQIQNKDQEIESLKNRINTLLDSIQRGEQQLKAAQDALTLEEKARDRAAHDIAREQASRERAQKQLADTTLELVNLREKTSMDYTALLEEIRAENKRLEAMINANTKETPVPNNEPTMLQKIAASKAVTTLKVDANDAAWRLAGSQFIKLAKEPLIAALMRHLGPDDESLRGRLAVFLDTELGVSILAGLLSAGLSAIPGDPGAVPAMLARELRIRAMAGAGDALADVLMGPLRQVAVMYLQAPAAPSDPAALPGGSPIGVDNVVDFERVKAG